jgi:hypothetical protein
MDEKTLTALRGSIAKWEGIERGDTPDAGWHICPLCRTFNTSGESCSRCPVRERTGRRYCGGTPYNSWVKLEDQGEEDVAANGYAITPLAKKVAGDMAAFLRGLLPQEEQKS